MGANYCFGCGADLAEDAKVCPACGRDLTKLVNEPFLPAVPEIMPQEPEPPEPELPREKPAREELTQQQSAEQETEIVKPSRLRGLIKKTIGVLFVIDGLLGLDYYIGETAKMMKKARRRRRLPLALLFDLLLVIIVIIGNRIVYERMPDGGGVPVKQPSGRKRKAAGAVIIILGLFGTLVTFYATVSEFMESSNVDAEDCIEMFTIDLMFLFYVGLGIKLFLPRTVMMKAPADDAPSE